MILIPNLADKANYMLHYRSLQLYLSLEMILTKIHKFVRFKQSDRIKKNIDFNTGKRRNAVSSFKKSFLN